METSIKHERWTSTQLTRLYTKQDEEKRKGKGRRRRITIYILYIHRLRKWNRANWLDKESSECDYSKLGIEKIDRASLIKRRKKSRERKERSGMSTSHPSVPTLLFQLWLPLDLDCLRLGFAFSRSLVATVVFCPLRLDSLMRYILYTRKYELPWESNQRETEQGRRGKAVLWCCFGDRYSKPSARRPLVNNLTFSPSVSLVVVI